MVFFGPGSEWNMDPEADRGIWNVDAPYSQRTIEPPQFVDPRNGLLRNDATRDDTYGTWLGNEPEPAPPVDLEMGDDPHGPDTQLEAMVLTGKGDFPADVEMRDVNDTYGETMDVPGHAPRYKTPVDFAPMEFTSTTFTPMSSMPMGSMPMGSMPMGSMPMGSMPMGSMPMGSMPMGTTPMSIALASIPLVDITHADACPNASNARSSTSKSDSKTRERRAPSIVSSQHSSSTRTRHTPEAVARWEDVFQIKRYPDSETVQKLAKETDKSVKQVRTWFNNRRSVRNCKKDDGKEKGLNAKAPVFVPQRLPVDLPRGGFEILRTSHNQENERAPSSSGPRLSQTGAHARQGSRQLLAPPGTASMYDASQSSRPTYSNLPSSPPSVSNLTSTSRASRNGRKQHAQTGPQSERDDPSCRFQCLFCQASFDKMYSWQRHETSQHFQMETYVCRRETIVPLRDGSGSVGVVSKNCSHTSEERRTFYRKDGAKKHALNGHTINGRKLHKDGDAEIIKNLLDIWRRESGDETHALQARTCQRCGREFTHHQARWKHMADVHFPPAPITNDDTRVDYGRSAIEERREPYVTGGRLMGAGGAIVPLHHVAELGFENNTAAQDLWMERNF